MLSPKAELCSSNDTPSAVFESEVDNTAPDERPACRPKRTEGEGYRTPFVQPIFETDYDMSTTESDYVPSASSSSSYAYSTRRGSSGIETVNLVKEPNLSNERGLSRRRYADKAIRRSPRGGKKVTALARIKDDITQIEAQTSPRSKHIQRINGKNAADVPYGHLDAELDNLSKTRARLCKLNSDKDIDLADSDRNTGYCQGCRKLLNVPSLSQWIDHKIRCRRLQEKLQHEIEERDGLQKAHDKSKSSNGERRYTLRRQPESILRPVKAEEPTPRIFKQNELVSVRVGDKVKQFRYTTSHSRTLLDGKSLSKVYYGMELPRGGVYGWPPFVSDPDIKSFSRSNRICICRGCGQTITLERTTRWLEHRFRCPDLQSLGEVARNQDQKEYISEIAGTGDTEEGCSGRYTPPDVPKSYFVRKRKRDESRSSGECEKGELIMPARPRRIRYQAPLTPERAESHTRRKTKRFRRGVMLGLSAREYEGSGDFKPINNDIRTPKGFLSSWFQAGPNFVNRVRQIVDDFE